MDERSRAGRGARWFGGLSGLILSTILFGAASVRAGPIVSPGAGLGPTSYRVHPDASLDLSGDPFNVYTGSAMPSGWSLVDSLSSGFANGTMQGTFYSQVWKASDGHLLFAYRIANSGTAAIRNGNIWGFGHGFCQVTDSGILDLNGDLAFDQGDVLRLGRADGTRPQLVFAFEAEDSQWQIVERLLAGGQTSFWFYAETDCTTYMSSTATLQDSGASADKIPVLVPAPEPACLWLMGLGAAGLALVGRRRGNGRRR